MILVLGDVHSRFDLVNSQTDHAETRLGAPIDAIVVLGDFGLFEPTLSRFFRKQGMRFLRPVFFIEGNHEDYSALPRLVERYSDVMTHLPRGTIHDIAGLSCLALGGAAYMDSLATPMGSVITPADIERCLAHQPGSAACVLSHDCPAGLGIPSTPGFEHCGPPGFPGGDSIRAHLKPRIWLFGHHHRWFERRVEDTRFHGLVESWRGYGLLAPDGAFTAVSNEIPVPPKRSLQRRIASWLGIK